MYRSLFLTALTIGFALISLTDQASAICAAPTNMNGTYRANDGGTYYIRQVGNTVWWLGVSADDGRHFTNVFKGTKNGDSIVGEWADVPRGAVRSSGVLHLQGSPGSFRRVHVTGGFGGSQWTLPCDDVVLNPQ
jgi:hypothetical protein